MDVHQYFYPGSSEPSHDHWASSEGLKNSIDNSFIISIPKKDAEKIRNHGYTIHKNMDIEGTLNDINKEDNTRMAIGIFAALLIIIGIYYLIKKSKKSYAISSYSATNNNNYSQNISPSIQPQKTTYRPKVSNYSNNLTDFYNKKNSRSSNGNNNLRDLSAIQAKLTLAQKEASICLISYFAGYIDDVTTNYKVPIIINMASNFFNIDTSPSNLAFMMSRYNDPEILIDTIMSIKENVPKEYLLLTCYDLSKISGKREAINLLINIANDLGYDNYSFNKLIKNYKSV
jgi:hypothetical protein